ncbi:unnamed protein product [Microthlaspi erraticum]|uniref:Uncharacterized protein n=1 Tax=Microthlaspi erraticum TaxID=1685480 RepID=A0A6D2JPR7_9BRAS|nr:unnamed protein product [Microthlaspi erraticum]
MDFIKTSSLRALIELTFQRNWNGLIWMSRKGVITKRVRLSRRLYRETAPNRAVRLAEETMFRARPKSSVRLKSRPKFQTDRPITQRPGKHVPRSAKPNAHATPRTTKAREPGNKPRGRATFRATADASVRAGKERPTSGRETSAKSSSVHHAGRPFRLGHDPTVRPIVPTTVPTPRSTRSPFEAHFIFSSPA